MPYCPSCDYECSAEVLEANGICDACQIAIADEMEDVYDEPIPCYGPCLCDECRCIFATENDVCEDCRNGVHCD